MDIREGEQSSPPSRERRKSDVCLMRAMEATPAACRMGAEGVFALDNGTSREIEFEAIGG